MFGSYQILLYFCPELASGMIEYDADGQLAQT